MSNEKTYCLNCGKELEHKEGRRKKKYCNSTCKSLVWYSENKEHMKEYREKKKAEKELKAKTKKVKPTAPTSKSYDTDNKTVVNDEAGQTQKSNDELITTYETEMNSLGDTPLAKQRKKFLANKIYELKQKS